ncbi:hypothetical protein [Methylobacterium sp. OT2]|uniref:GAP1-N1 domain-containing protein n=1 Tax=Methylobacterium sp. OT2 TaxID=2813779 RepID=UPI00197BF770|nr:hypothetical protein [Methylobacterium sp. OT2]MBN4097046.1 hypothetical protein [Methylobacterium sp. OT2]
MYGYSDGHRQLAASTQLSSADAYELATRSDLASNARLGPGASYVGGFTLKDNGVFAFIKTWPAPEMPRPGCVWSHVLILPRKFLMGQVNLGVLKGLFRKPGSGASFDEFTRKIEVKRLIKSRPADRLEVQRIISAYYTGRPLDYIEAPGETFEEALLAVWSQQWPKLRADFQFRVVFGSLTADDKRGLTIRVGSSGPPTSSPDGAGNPKSWISAAANDATSPTVTPLRRFLWRYGKDAQRPRTAFRPLVEVFLAEAEHTTHLPSTILNSFPKPLDAATLKRDALGVTPAALSLTERLDGEDFVSLALSSQALTSGLVKAEELETAIGAFDKRDLKSAAIALGRTPNFGSSDAERIAGAVARVIEPEALSDEAIPISFVMRVLGMRPKLIEGFDATRLDEADILSLLEVAPDSSAVARLLSALLIRPPSEQSSLAIVRWIGEAFVQAVGLSSEGTLHGEWRHVFPSHARKAVASGLGELKGVKAVSHAVALIDFSTDHDTKPSAFVKAAGRPGLNATDAESADLDVYLLVLCSRRDVAKTMAIVSDVLPRVRNVALNNGFSDLARRLLDHYLPYLSESWDLNKRLLKLLRNARRDGADITSALRCMTLSKEELRYLFDDDDEVIKTLMSHLLWPFYRI